MAPTWRCWRAASASASPESGGALLPLLAGIHVVVEAERHAFPGLRKVRRERRERAAGGQSVGGGSIEGRHPRRTHRLHARDHAALLDHEALADPPADAGFARRDG